MQHGRQVEGIGVVAENVLARFQVCEPVQSDLCYTDLMLALQHQALPPNDRCLQHFIGLFAKAVNFGALLYRASEEVVHAHPWETDHVFQDVDAFFRVEGSHLCQRF